MWIVLAIFAVLFGLLLVYIQRNGGFGFPWVQFYVRGKEHGFKFRELNLLRRVAVENRLKNPTSLFWSERTLDRCIRGTIISFRANDKSDDEASIHFLNKLFDFRKRVEFNLPKYRLGIQSSRSMDAQQPIKITFPGGGAYTSKIVENMRKYLAVAYPRGKPLPFGVSWQGQKISVYFWRPDDAGYYFESRVIGDYMDRNYPILHITHSDQLVRTQKRSSVRAQIDTAGQIFPLRSIQQADEAYETTGGFRCKMVDISEDGAAVIVGGRAKPGLPVKIQTEMDEEQVVISGVIKGVNYRQNKNVSVLHIEAVPPGPQMKNKILTYVYGIFAESKRRSLLSRTATG
jgi:c-di-GMP-binding flagellar brake protein YcgR